MLSASEVCQEKRPPDKVAVTSNLQVDEAASVRTISSGSKPTGKTACRYILSKRECPFGDRCRYRHSVTDSERDEHESSVKTSRKDHRSRQQPVCRHFQASGCRYGDTCKYYHPHSVSSVPPHPSPPRSTEPELSRRRDDGSPSPPLSPSPPPLPDQRPSDGSQLLNTSAFPGLQQGTKGPAVPPPQAAAKPPPPSLPHPPPAKTSQRGGPPPLSLDAFFKPSGLPARPAVSRPRPRRNVSAPTDLLRVELEQLETRFPGDLCRLVEKGREKTVYRLTFSPTDPDWHFPYKSVVLLVSFPSSYPSSLFTVELCPDQPLPPAIVSYSNASIAAHVETLVPSSGRGKQPELLFRKFIHWLDHNLTAIFRDATRKMYSAEFSTAIEGEQEGESDEEGESEEEEEEERGSQEEEESGGEECEGSSEEDRSDDDQESPLHPLTMPAKRGTEIRLLDLALSKGVGTVRCDTIKLVVGCTRYKHHHEVILKAESPSPYTCLRCSSTFSLTYHAALLHTASCTVGFLDLMGCLPVDLVLVQCDVVMACLECGRENPARGLSYGQPRDMWCRRCHALLTLATEQSKFVNHQPGVVDVLPSSPHKAPKQRGQVFKEGTPLPESGTCTHYKKSHRWLRFPCCGKAYPCDVCHDTSEDHPMERANRMICGFCSREQTYSGLKPCVLCGGDLTQTKSSLFWEGGQGCRNKTKMSCNDSHKYSSSDQKTASKKQDRVGQRGKGIRQNSSAKAK